MKIAPLFLSLLFLTSCDGELEDLVFSEKNQMGLYTLVYLDLSTSQDSVSISNSIDLIKKIYKNQSIEIETRFVVRTIDKDHSVRPLCDIIMPAIEDSREYMIDARTNEKDSIYTHFDSLIWDYYKNVVPLKTSSRESCICNSLENAHASLAIIDTTRFEIQVIVLSDMFEECSEENSYLNQSFYMCEKNKFLKPFDELKQDIIQNYAVKHPISKYVRPENLYFILSESDDYNESSKRCLNPNELEALWQELIKKMGYQHDLNSANGVTFTTELPDRLVN